jgi:hypothetical protein
MTVKMKFFTLYDSRRMSRVDLRDLSHFQKYYETYETKRRELKEKNRVLIDGSLFKGRTGSGVFSEELDLKLLSLLERSTLSFRLRFTPLWLFPTSV